MNEEDWSSIEQVPVYTEKELANEFESFTPTLNGTSVDWNKRLKALKRIEGLILGGAFHLDNFPSLLCKLCYHINTQLNDLRSAISKEACTLVCLAAKKGGESLEAFCDKIITKECLLKLINTANKLMADNGHMCMITLLEEVKSHKVIPKIIEELSSKNPSLRQKIAEYLNIIVSSYDKSIVEKYQTIIEGAITTAISDANKDVRQTTRKTFHAYTELFPARGDKMLSNFDLSIQKALIDDGIVDSSFSPLKKSGGITPPPKSSQRPSSAASGKQKKAEPANNGQTDMQKTYSTAYTFDSEKVQSAGIPKKPLKEPTSAKSAARSTPTGEKSATNSKTGESTTTTSRFSNAVNKSLKEGGEKVKTAGSSPITNMNKSFNGGQTEERPESRGGRSHTPKRVLNTSTSQRMSPRVPSVKNLGSREFDSSKQSLAPNEINLIKKNVTDFYQTIKDEDLKFLLDKTGDENWATRSNSFEKVNEFIAELKPDEEIGNPLMNQLILAHIQHINDSHYKVVIACQDSFSRLLTVYSAKILSYMDKIVPLLFMNLTDGKEKVSASTNFVVNLINKIYMGDELFPHFLRALDYSPKPAYKTSMLEFMNVLIKGCKKHFSSPQATRSCLQKLATIMNEFYNQKKILLPCLGMILYLRELDPETTISTLVNIKEPMFTNFLNIAAEYAPDLEQEIADVKGIGSRDTLKSKGGKSPSKRAKSKTNDSMVDYSKANQSFTNEAKVPKTMTENDVNMSMISLTANEKKKHESFSRLSKESKHTNSNPCLTNFISTKQKIIAVDNGFQPQTTTYKEQNSMWEEGQNVRVMQFDFDDEESQNLKSGLSIMNNSKSIPIPKPKKEEKLDLSNLDAIQRIIEQYPKNKSLVEEKLSHILAALLKLPLAQNAAPYDRALELLRKMLNLPLKFGPYTRELMAGIIALYHLPQKAYAQIDNVLKMVTNFGSTDDCLDSMLVSLEKEDHPIVQIVVKNITHIFLRDKDMDLTHYLSALFEKYYELINHNNPDVRKNVVFSIVDLHSIYAEEIEGYLQEFSPSHQKLIDIYIQKRAEKEKTDAK